VIDDKITEDKFSKFYFRSVCIKLVALRMNLYQEVALSFKKVDDPCLTGSAEMSPLGFTATVK